MNAADSQSRKTEDWWTPSWAALSTLAQNLSGNDRDLLISALLDQLPPRHGIKNAESVLRGMLGVAS